MTRTITLYTKDYCPYCKAAKALLHRKGARFTNHEITGKPALRAEMIQRAGGLRTVPQIFIGGVHVGGYDALTRLDARGELDGLLGLVRTA
ncbi:putative glutaredoxin 3 [Dinoroseobacter shibae DFL 12 = DSM 16493]|jgi:glutaredoxin 3|uniref:Glutaredoxin n=1 Tax=Dinoroseobacter shibae (strain DSM 16493 / NCIMB 14021 / DFL 12) TaxID=398580 RepID=A8LNA5_DINSH|nr:glutaredoxin 3 [Dinoroseobacter shibae]ABV93618.1 putative glutaredoxin 3 [Dinoroseobacter shibae DFL 12 = DSM 16493]URF45070.1 glutaredoxin 3 [Dinoroseobacter shibae]URF49374.1 glutaredoxin 3 [Dinoroseobacter shibae]